MEKIKHEDIILRGIIVATCTMLVATSVFPIAASLSIHKDMITTTQTAENNFIDTQPTASMNLEYSFLFRSPLLQRVDMQKNMFTTMEMPGSYIIGTTPGTPVFLVKPTKILLPQGTEVTHVDVTADKTMEVDTKASDIDLKEKPVVPYQLPVPIGEHPSNFVINHEAYASINQIPDQIFENLDVGYCRGYAILTVNLYPTQYIPGEGRLFYHPEMTIKITLKENGPVNQFYRNDPSDRAWVESLVCNPEITKTYNPHTLGGSLYPGGLCNPSDNGGRGYDYVIITRAALFDFTGTAYNWTSLINKKQAEGLQATKVKVEDIIACHAYWNTNPLFNDTPARIREFCKDAYQDWGTDYILIGGDQDGTNNVQRRLMYYEYEGTVETDIYWTHLDNTFNADHDSQWGEGGDAGFDLYSELYSGSIPCDTGADVSNWLTKTFFYADNLDKNYLDNAAFYGGDMTWDCEGDDFIDYSAIKGTNDWLGPNPHVDGPYPTWVGFQYGFETWNQKNPVSAYNLSVKWTAEPPNPGWQGGSDSAAITGLKNAINSDKCTLISAVAHANPSMSMDVYDYEWEANYHNTKPFFLHDYGCHCGDMDGEDDGVLHSMLLHSNTELAFACVYNTGYGWGNYYSTNSSSALQQKSFWDYLFDTTNNSGSTMNWQMGKAQEWARDFMAPTINWDPGYEDWRGIIESCLLFGDPAQSIKPPLMPQHNVGVQSLDVPSHVIPDQQVNVNATVVNNGRNNELNVLVSFRVNGTQLNSTTIPFFANHTTQHVSFPWTPSLGWYTVTINVTIPGVNEEFYADNEKSTTVIAGPDIAVTSLDVNQYVSVGSLTPVYGTVENLGATSESVTVYLTVNGTFEDSQSFMLTTGASQPVTFQWNPTTCGTYLVGIQATVAGVEPYTQNNQMSKMVTVFEPQGYVLLVDDDTGDSYETFYENALLASQYLYNVWDRTSQGCPPVNTMLSYSAVVWFTGDDSTSTLDSTDKTNLAAYLNSGGGLFITGQDIGYNIHSDSDNFYTNYLHAAYQVDDTNILTLNGVADDPIGDGLVISISGGDGANNQNWPDGITPITPATTVFTYQSSSYAGGLRVDTGVYKVVYFGFGFEAISTMDDRAEVMERVLAWIGGTYTTPDIWINPTQFDIVASPGEILNKTLTIGNDANATKELSFTIEIPHGWILQWEHQYGGQGHSQLAQPVGDIDGDGVNEVIVGGYASYSAIILSYNKNTGTYDQEYEWSEGGGTPSGACIANLDGTGGLELVVSWVYGTADGIYAYRWDGSTLTTLSVYSGIGFDFAYDVYACDYDDDGHVEVLIANSPSSSSGYQVTALGWNTGGGFVREVSWGSGQYTECPMVWSGDTDHDGKTEVIAAAGYSTVYALNYASGAWTATTVASGLPGHPYGIAVGDLDGNLGNEIGIGLEGTQAYIYKWTGSSYQQVWYHDYAGEQDIIEATAIGDADNDGQNEFLIGTNDIHVISHTGGSYSEESTIIDTDGQLAGTIIGDCDTDGLNEVKACDIITGPGKEWIIKYHPAPTWLSVSPTSGTVDISESMNVTLMIDATNLAIGNYTSSVLIHSNDFDENSLEIPVHVEVKVTTICGDTNNDGIINVVDVVYLINYLFVGGPAPVPMKCVGDCNGDGVLNVSDVIYLINYLFINGPPPSGCCR